MTTTKKLKIVCSFNGKFRRRPPWNKPRYTGGESKLISVDPTTLSYSKLSSLITERVNNYSNNNKNLQEFKLKYRLPGTESGEAPLVLLANDDDVLCMVEEFEVYCSKNFNDNKCFPRLWVYVCHGKDDDDEYEHAMHGNDVGFLSLKEKEISSNDFGCGFRVLGRNLMDSLKGNHGFKRLNNVAKNHGTTTTTNNNNNRNSNVVGNGRRSNKVSSSEHDSLRKLVLKQQLMLARQRDQIRDIGRYLGQNYDGSSCGDDQPLIDLRQKNSDSIVVADEVVCDQEFRRAPNCRDGGLFEEKRMTALETLEGKFGLKMSNDCSLYKQEQGFGQTLVSQHLNRQNVLLSCNDQIVQSLTIVESVDRGISNQNSGLTDVRDPKSRLYCHGEGYPGVRAIEAIPKQGLAEDFKCQKSAGLSSSTLDNKAFPQQSEKANVEAQTYVQAVQSQMHQYVGGHLLRAMDESLIDFSEEPIGDNYVNDFQNQANGYDANAIGVYVSQGIANYACSGATTGAASANNSCMLMPVERGVEAMRNCQTSFNSLADAISINLSSYNPSLSSSNMETLPFSRVNSKVSVGSQIAQLDLLDSATEVKKLEETEANITALDSVNGITTKWDHSCTLQEGIQDEPAASTTVCDEVVIRKSLKYSNITDRIPSDLAVFLTHLATRELQTINDSDLEYIKEIGSGKYGTVYHGKWKGSDVAIKKLKQSCFNVDAKEEDRMIADFWKEAHMLGQLHHPNIVAFYGVVTNGPVTNLATVTEYMVNGSLRQVLLRKDRTIDRRKRIIIAMDAAFGMEYLHEKNIVHFDLKSHNFLVNMRDPKRPVCKIGDLGLSKIKQKTMVSGGIRGTIPWMAPELLSTSANLVSEKVDVYSFGIVMWELLTGEEPYADMRSVEIIAGIIRGTLRPEIPNWCDPAWRSLMERCWSSDPYSRPAFSEIATELRAMSSAMNLK